MIVVESLEELKAKVSIVDFVDQLGYHPKRAGASYVISCPFHEERTPSLALYPNTNTWKCFGCGKGSNVIDFVMYRNNLGFYDAAMQVAQMVGFNLQITHHAPKSKPGYEVLAYAHGLFTQELSQQEGMLAYLQERGLSLEDVKYYELGFCSAKVLEQLNKRFSLEQLQECGLFNGKYCFLSDRLSFAYKDHKGRVCGFSGHSTAKPPKYINSKESPYFHKSKHLWNLERALPSIIQKKQIIITEGFFDVIAFGRFGYPNAVCCSGTSFNASHLEYLANLGVEIVLCLDNDRAGLEATMRALKLCFNKDKPYASVSVVYFADPKIKDMGQCLQKPALFKQEGWKYFTAKALSPKHPPQQRDKHYRALMSLIENWTPFLKHSCLEELGKYAPKPIKPDLKARTHQLERAHPRLKAPPLWPEGRILVTMLLDLAFRYTAKSFLHSADFQFPQVFEALCQDNLAGLHALPARFKLLPPSEQEGFLRAFKLKGLQRALQHALEQANYPHADALAKRIKELRG
ncbi:CHC2 zinc finger domain-containing protein [Helicobacter bizzozeronii]|uniref:CHC2 zinc finger domain-containing protein n=1 Tax=Helicobacter bizzozeronii TaxID=56877 RepID=UPI000CEDFF88|nr:CHC2 zinc finger domain-containing protein [Helicobacter bizzozeronii]